METGAHPEFSLVGRYPWIGRYVRSGGTLLFPRLYTWKQVLPVPVGMPPVWFEKLSGHTPRVKYRQSWERDSHPCPLCRGTWSSAAGRAHREISLHTTWQAAKWGVDVGDRRTTGRRHVIRLIRGVSRRGGGVRRRWGGGGGRGQRGRNCWRSATHGDWPPPTNTAHRDRPRVPNSFPAPGGSSRRFLFWGGRAPGGGHGGPHRSLMPKYQLQRNFKVPMKNQKFWTYKTETKQTFCMAGEAGVDLPLRTHLSYSWVGPGGPNTCIPNENGPFLLILDCFSATSILVCVVLGPLRHLGTLFLEGPKA